jgi:hypothetical protein
VLEGLLEVVGRPALHRRYRALDVAEGGDHDDRRLRMPRAQLAQHLDPVDVGQPKIDHGQVRIRLIGQLQAVLAGAGGVHFDVVLTENPRDERSDVTFVVDHENRVHALSIVADRPSR